MSNKPFSTRHRGRVLPTYKTLILAALACLLTSLNTTAKELVIAANPVDGQQRLAFHQQIKAFEYKHPDIQVTVKAYEHESYKEQTVENLSENIYDSDVFFWFGGESLRYFADQGWIKDLSPLWQKNGWHESLSASSQHAVSRQGKTYGVPLYYYQWGIYYRKSIFERYHLNPPETWSEFLIIAEKLKSKNIIPLTLGSKNHWTAAAWFDYFNFRLNGLDFHLNLLSGCYNFMDIRLKEVFTQLSLLQENNLIIPNAAELDWRGALPYLYHAKSAMILMGNFFLATVPDNIRHDIGFFPFPKMKKDIPIFEDAPVDVLVVPSNSKNDESVEAFLAFMASPDAQSRLAQALNMIPTNRMAALADDESIKQGFQLLNEAQGLAQFFDRDTPPRFAEKAQVLISRFVTDPKRLPDIQYQLEKLRQAAWPEKADGQCSTP